MGFRVQGLGLRVVRDDYTEPALSDIVVPFPGQKVGTFSSSESYKMGLYNKPVNSRFLATESLWKILNPTIGSVRVAPERKP